MSGVEPAAKPSLSERIVGSLPDGSNTRSAVIITAPLLMVAVGWLDRYGVAILAWPAGFFVVLYLLFFVTTFLWDPRWGYVPRDRRLP